MSFELYLRHEKRMNKSTAYRCGQQARSFENWLEVQGLIIEELAYKEIMDYVEGCRTSNNCQNTIIRKIRTIRQYLDYKYVLPNPCDQLQLKTRPDPLPSPLLTEVEIEELYNCYPEWTIQMKRDKVMLGIVCFQGATGGEITRLRLEEVYVDIGFIRLRGGRWSESRSIRMNPLQVELLKEYIEQIRGEILQDRYSELLGVKIGPTAEAAHLRNYIYRLCDNVRECYPNFKNIPQLRASVICNWLKKENIREVQYKAGHKTITATERYKQGNTDDLQSVLDDLHPLR